MDRTSLQIDEAYIIEYNAPKKTTKEIIIIQKMLIIRTLASFVFCGREEFIILLLLHSRTDCKKLMIK